MYTNLTHYIETLEQAGELVRIRTAVDPLLEITEITDRESKCPGGGRALLFENTGTAFPVLTNMMGSDRRIAMALGVERVEELTERIEALFAALTTPKPGLMDKLRMLPLLEQMSRWLPRNRKGRGLCQEVILRGEAACLSLLPVLKCWPHDGGRFITLPLVNTIDPDSGIRNVGMYRMQLFAEQQTGMHWHLHKTGERHYRRYQALGRRMPIAVCLGGDPAYTYAATAPMPDNMDEYLLAGFLRRRPVELVKCLTSEIRVPADCDFVIEGYVDPSEARVTEGPFGDHTGFYSLEDLYPRFHVTAITHRRGAVYPATIVGVPPQEDAYIAKATEQIFLVPIRRTLLPEINTLYMPTPGVAHNIAVVDITRNYIGQGLKVSASLWGAGQMMFNKYMVITSGEPDVRDAEQLAKLLRRTRVPEHIVLSRGPLDVLDHAAPRMGLGGKMAFDLTEVSSQEEVLPAQLPDVWNYAMGVKSSDLSLIHTWGVLLLYAEPTAPLDIPSWLHLNPIDNIPFIVVMDCNTESLSHEERLWLASSNCDPSRDVRIDGNRVIFDARTKAGGVNGFDRRWPNVVASSLETIALVDRRWETYGLGEKIESPSRKYRLLQRHDAAEY